MTNSAIDKDGILLASPYNTDFMGKIKTIGRLALPITIGAIAQNTTLLIDTIMVGRLGQIALAGFAGVTFLYALLLVCAMGIQQSVQVVVARRLGETQGDNIGRTINSGLIVAVLFGLTLVPLGYLLLPFLNQLLFNDPAVVQLGNSYLNTVIPSILFSCVYYSIDGYLLGSKKVKYSMLAFFVLAVSNTVFNFALIYGELGAPEMGLAGAGLGTTLANVIAVLFMLAIIIFVVKPKGFLKEKPQRQDLRSISKLVLPANVGNIIRVSGILVFTSVVGLLGNTELAASAILVRIMVTMGLVSSGIGSAATTLVSENIGRGEISAAKQYGWLCAFCALLFNLLFGALFFLIFPNYTLSLFTENLEVIAVSIAPLMFLCITMIFEGFMVGLSQALIGAGAIKQVMLLAISIYWLVRLPLNWLIGVKLGYGLDGIFVNGMIIVILSTLLFSFVWKSENWKSIKI